MFIKYFINFLLKKITPTVQIIMCHTPSEMLLYLTLWEIKTTSGKKYQTNLNIRKNSEGWGGGPAILTCI